MVALAAMLTAGLAGCAPTEAVDPTEGCGAAGSPPPGEPGSAEVLLTVASAPGTRLLSIVLYTDGWVLLAADLSSPAVNALTVPLMAPPPPAGRPWQAAYVGSCQLDGIAELAAEELATDADLGDPQITDQSTTLVTYYGGASPAVTRAYALGAEEGSRLSRADRQGRAVLTGLIAALRDATRTGEVLPVERVQVTGDIEDGEPAGWPGPPLAELLVVEDYCGELTGEEARTVLEYLSSTEEDVGWLRAEVVPPGLPACG